jgi:hypothetical protein
MFKRILSIFLSVTLLVQPMAATASVSSAFSSLLGSASSSTSGAGQFSTQTRDVFTGGGAEVRFGSKSVTFISVSPPSLNIGCAGISAYFGGFSFINSAQIAQLLQNISQVAVAFAIKLAIKTLCPTCEAVLADLTALAQKAAAGSQDACSLGKQLAQGAADMFGVNNSGNEAAPKNCAAVMDANGKAEDYGDAAETVCNSIAGLTNWFDTTFGASSPNASQPDKGAAFEGNLAWLTLEALGFEKPERRVIMSLTGSVINYLNWPGHKVGCLNGPIPSAPSDGSGALAEQCFLPPLIQDLQDMSDLMMCGTTGHTSTHEYVRNLCLARNTERWASDGLPYYTCVDDGLDADPELRCMNPRTSSTLSDLSEFASSTGFLHHIYDALARGITAVSTGAPMPTQTVQLINVTPFPLYKMLNLAAIYPAAAQDLLNSNAVVIANVVASGYLRRMLLEAPRPKSQSIPGAAGVRMSELLQQMAKDAKSEVGNVLSFLTLQERMLANIQSVNRAVQVNVMSQGLLSNHSYSLGVVKGAGR